MNCTYYCKCCSGCLTACNGTTVRREVVKKEVDCPVFRKVLRTDERSLLRGRVSYFFPKQGSTTTCVLFWYSCDFFPIKARVRWCWLVTLGAYRKVCGDCNPLGAKPAKELAKCKEWAIPQTAQNMTGGICSLKRLIRIACQDLVG